MNTSSGALRANFWFLVYTLLAKPCRVPSAVGADRFQGASAVRGRADSGPMWRTGEHRTCAPPLAGATTSGWATIPIWASTAICEEKCISARFSIMGPEVVIWTTNHRIDRIDIPILQQRHHAGKAGLDRQRCVDRDAGHHSRWSAYGDHAVVAARAVGLAKDVPGGQLSAATQPASSATATNPERPRHEQDLPSVSSSRPCHRPKN